MFCANVLSHKSIISSASLTNFMTTPFSRKFCLYIYSSCIKTIDQKTFSNSYSGKQSKILSILSLIIFSSNVVESVLCKNRTFLFHSQFSCLHFKFEPIYTFGLTCNKIFTYEIFRIWELFTL